MNQKQMDSISSKIPPGLQQEEGKCSAKGIVGFADPKICSVIWPGTEPRCRDCQTPSQSPEATQLASGQHISWISAPPHSPRWPRRRPHGWSCSGFASLDRKASETFLSLALNARVNLDDLLRLFQHGCSMSNNNSNNCQHLLNDSLCQALLH